MAPESQHLPPETSPQKGHFAAPKRHMLRPMLNAGRAGEALQFPASPPEKYSASPCRLLKEAALATRPGNRTSPALWRGRGQAVSTRSLQFVDFTKTRTEAPKPGMTCATPNMACQPQKWGLCCQNPVQQLLRFSSAAVSLRPMCLLYLRLHVTGAAMHPGSWSHLDSVVYGSRREHAQVLLCFRSFLQLSLTV